VLGRFNEKEQEIVTQNLSHYSDIVLSFTQVGLDKTMNQFNGKPPKASS